MNRYDLVTTPELLASGLSHSAISRRVARGELVRRYPGVYSRGSTVLSREAGWLAAVLAAGEEAALSHVPAADLWGCSRFHVAVPHVVVPKRHRPIEGVVVHHARGLDPRDVTMHLGIPVTTVARTMIDLSDILTAHQLANVIFESGVELRDLEAAAARAVGRHNLEVLRRAIALVRAGSKGTCSASEDAFLELIADLPEPLVNVDHPGFHWPDRNLLATVTESPGT